jgi:hypothetical protein
MDEQMQKWKDGEISDSEIMDVILRELNEVATNLCVVRSALRHRENKVADERMAKLFAKD